MEGNLPPRVDRIGCRGYTLAQLPLGTGVSGGIPCFRVLHVEAIASSRVGGR